MQSRKTLRNKLDKICSKIVRRKGKCERCGNTQTLQCCHIYSRTYNATRFDLENLLCLCASCHFFYHKNPIEFAMDCVILKGQEAIDILREKRNSVGRYTTEELETKLRVLNEIYSV